MSRRKASEPLTKVTLNLYSRDYERMQAMYPTVGATVAVRELVRRHVVNVEAKTAKIIDTSIVEELEIELEQ